MLHPATSCIVTSVHKVTGCRYRHLLHTRSFVYLCLDISVSFNMFCLFICIASLVYLHVGPRGDLLCACSYNVHVPVCDDQP